MEVDYKFSGDTIYRTLKNIGQDEAGDDTNEIQKDDSTVKLTEYLGDLENVFVASGIKSEIASATKDIKPTQKIVDKLKNEIDDFKNQILSGTTDQTTLTNLRVAQKDLEKEDKKLKKLKSKSLLLLRVTGYYNEAKSSSTKTVEFKVECKIDNKKVTGTISKI